MSFDRYMILLFAGLVLAHFGAPAHAFDPNSPLSAQEAKEVGARVPSDIEQRDTLKLVQQLFREEFKKTTTSAQKLAIVHKMLKAADETENLVEQFVLWRIARDIAAGAGDADATIKAIDRIDAVFEVDALAMKLVALRKVTIAATSKGQRASVGEALLNVAQEGVDAGRVEIASPSVTSARTILSEFRSKEQFARLNDLSKAIVVLTSLQTELQVGQATLQRDPTDLSANRIVGRYRCLILDDWVSGLPLLVRGSGGPLQRLAKQELAEPDEASEQVVLGDGWWQQAETETEPLRKKMRDRAAHWYSRAMPELTGLAMLKTKQRLKELDFVATADRSSPSEPDVSNNSTGRNVVVRGGALKLYYKRGGHDANDNQLNPHIKIANVGSKPVSLSDVTVRYWFTVDGPRDQKVWVDYAKLDGKNITGTFHSVSKPTALADVYLELVFSANIAPIESGGDSGPIQLRIAKQDWTKYDETNDHSFGGGAAVADFQEFTRITLYHQGKLVWGEEPMKRKKK